MKNKQVEGIGSVNLNRLKDTVEEFGRISVTSDYTNSEQEEIKNWIKKAEEKSGQDPENVFKVRGNPKNGLRLVVFVRKETNGN